MKKQRYLSSVCMFILLELATTTGWLALVLKTKRHLSLLLMQIANLFSFRGLNARKAMILRSKTEQNNPSFHTVNAVIVKYIIFIYLAKNFATYLEPLRATTQTSTYRFSTKGTHFCEVQSNKTSSLKVSASDFFLQFTLKAIFWRFNSVVSVAWWLKESI